MISLSIQKCSWSEKLVGHGQENSKKTGIIILNCQKWKKNIFRPFCNFVKSE